MTSDAASAALNLPQIIQDALQWDRQQWKSEGVALDPFYDVPADSSLAAPGKLLKLEETTDTSLYTIPPGTALSRFIYQSETMKGTSVPVSAYILWPYSPRESKNEYEVVAWAHGTSGFTPNSAPSHHRNLSQHYFAPFNLALNGYVVVATDYAGLGVGKTASGLPIPHEWLASPAQANDVIYSVQAAREAFPSLGKRFVVLGSSQGGGASWSIAQRQVTSPVDGYLGAIAVAPVTNILKETDPVRSMLALGLLQSIASYFPVFKEADVATPEGLQGAALVRALEAPTSTGMAMLMGANLLQSNWHENQYIQQYQELIVNGGKAISEPLLVIMGEADTNLQFSVAVSAFKETLEKFSDAPIEFISLPGVSHDPALTASQRFWMDWIADRFAGRDVDRSGEELQVKAGRHLGAYQPELNAYLSPATQFYQI
ncbi:prolyl aminopeptidase-like protein [Periconia macrospinosa]|uniref:Prolyl aminopeptidase-like protein n=1 Tax=Periconia macrospinosa TaxID=97972 RepID=A0A2V1DY95_9PLEO|nr:prolyl aminopeptidase-like protein [Periconia macrospinosa]